MNLQSEFMRPKKGFGPALLSFQHLKIQPGSWVKRGRRVKELAGDEAQCRLIDVARRERRAATGLFRREVICVPQL